MPWRSWDVIVMVPSEKHFLNVTAKRRKQPMSYWMFRMMFFSDHIMMMSNECHVVPNHQPFNCLSKNLCGPTSKNHQSPHYWPFVGGIHCWPVSSLHKGPVIRKKLPFDDVIMNVQYTKQGWNFPMGGVEACFVRSKPLSHKVMNDWLDVMSSTTKPME